MADEMRRLSDLLDKGIAALRDQALSLASAEADYRRGKSRAWVQIVKHEDDGSKRLAAQLEAEVNEMCAELREARDIAEGLRQAALEAVRSRRTQISALQSLLNAHKAEAEFVRTA